MKSSTTQQAKETAAEQAQRQAEQARAETSRVAQTQANLDASTLARLRRFGRINQVSGGAAGGVPVTVPNIGGGNVNPDLLFGGGFGGGGERFGVTTAMY